MGRFINADAFASTGQGILGNNMFAYCLNNPVNMRDPSGDIAVLDDLAIASSIVFVGIMGMVIVALLPTIEDVIFSGLNALTNSVFSIVEETAKIFNAKTKGKENIQDSGLVQESDLEVQRKAHDKSLPKSEQRRYQKEEKARGLRNKSKRNELY